MQNTHRKIQWKQLRWKQIQWKQLLLFLLLAAVLILPDRITKALAVKHLSGSEGIPLIPKVLYLLYVENRGAAFGVLNGAQGLFYIITVLVLGGILYGILHLPWNRHYRPMWLVSLLIFAGAIGNFIDRVRQAYVVDFIYFSPIDFPVFNVADIYVTCGCGLMVLLFLTVYREEDFSFLKPGRTTESSGKTDIPDSEGNHRGEEGLEC